MEEEKFEELIEDYLNFDECYEKIKLDRKDEKKSKDNEETPYKQKRVVFDRDMCIGINEFVNYYLLRDSEEKVNAHKLYHSSLKKLTHGNLIGISNEFAYQNPKYIKCGYLVVVLDGRKNPGTYINPIVLKNYIAATDSKKIMSKKWHKKSIIHDKNKIRKAYVELNRAICIYRLHCDLVNSLGKLIKETDSEKKITKINTKTL